MKNRRVLIIGAVALGPKVACRLKRLRPETDILMIDQDEHISYGGCGIPYFISGDISDVRELMSTSFHMLRSPAFFEEAKGVHVRVRTRAISLDRKEKTVRIQDLISGKQEDLSYDDLVIATGSVPNRLPIPGAELPEVVSVANLRSAIAIKERVSKGQVARAVIIGAGAIGCEMAEALGDLWGIETTIVEIADQVLPVIMERNLSRMVYKHLQEKGVGVHLGESVQKIERKQGSKGVTVTTSRRTLDADLVIASVGVHPNTELARNSGLLVSARGGIVVNHRLQTSDPNIYAGGDCIEVNHLLTGKPMFFPQGSLANRQGRIIGSNLAGYFASFKGVVGSFSIKIFDMAVASTGLTTAAAKREGFDAISTLVVQADRAHFYPTQDLMYLQLTVDKKNRRVLGAQGISGNGDALLGRINCIAAALPFRPTLDDLSNMELGYSPPFSSALDVLNAAGNNAENILDGYNRPLDPEDFEKLFMGTDENDLTCLDVRGPANAAPFVERFGCRWKNIPQEELARRIEEVPTDKPIAIICNSGARSYEAMRQLEAAGICRTVNVQGGVLALKKSGIIKTEEEDQNID